VIVAGTRWADLIADRGVVGIVRGPLALPLIPILVSGAELAGHVLRIVEGHAALHLVHGADGQEARETIRRAGNDAHDRPAADRAESCASSAAMRSCSGCTAARTSASVNRGVMCWGQFQSNAATSITATRSTRAR